MSHNMLQNTIGGLKLTTLVVIMAACLMASCQKEADLDTPLEVVLVDSVSSTDSVMIHYEVHGSGDRPLVLIHGWGCDRGYWSAQVENLSRDFRVIAVDLAGHGKSGLNRENWTMAAYGADVAAVVHKLGLHDVILVAHSMGGAVAIEAASLLKEKTCAIIGVDTYQDLVTPLDSATIKEYLDYFSADFKTNTEEFVRSTFLEDADTAIVNRIARDLASAPPEVGIASFANLFRYDAPARLENVRVPIRCINADRVPTNVEGNRSVCKSFEVVIMPGHSHWLHLEDSDRFNTLLRSTLEEFWPTPEAS